MRFALDLTLPTAAPKLRARLVDRAVGMEPTARQRATPGVHGQLTFQCDTATSLDKVLRPIAFAKAEVFQPVERVIGEAVVELGDVYVAGFQVGAAPHHLGDSGLGLGIEGIELSPVVAIAHRRADRLDPYRRIAQDPCDIHPRHHDRHRADRRGVQNGTT